MSTTISLDGIKAAIFDMDGTMIDNFIYHRKAWLEFLKRHDIELSDEEYQHKISGQKNDKIIELVFDNVSDPAQAKRLGDEKEELYRELYAEDIEEITGLTNCINDLQSRGIRTAIATTANRANREFALEALQLQGKFEVILGEEDVQQGKPSPEIYLKTADQLGVKPEECLVFEDSPPGVEAARSAGMRVVAILSAHDKDELGDLTAAVTDYTEISFA